MIRINLLPYRAARKKENIRIQVNVFIGSVLILLGIVFLVYKFLGATIENLGNEINSTKAQLEKYKKINLEIAEIKKKLAILDQKITVIQSLERDRKAPVQNLDSLYQLVVQKRMWYTQIEEKGNIFKISGVAIDNQTVADYMNLVGKSERFEKVQLKAIKQHIMKEQNLNLKKFDVNFNRKVPQAQKSVSTKGGKSYEK
ncbi:MAG: hypothetical protein GY874_06885 [Desulfobacteraceae bacterium]|nr:hypothetical protein [Desulfobacteraceae bacterium]